MLKMRILRIVISYSTRASFKRGHKAKRILALTARVIRVISLMIYLPTLMSPKRCKEMSLQQVICRKIRIKSWGNSEILAWVGCLLQTLQLQILPEKNSNWMIVRWIKRQRMILIASKIGWRRLEWISTLIIPQIMKIMIQKNQGDLITW